MNFLYPLGFAFAAVLPLIVLMYLLRLKRQKVVLSSILLWRKSLQDLQANAPFQKLRNNLLLWLQLLVAAMLVLGLARPMMNLAGMRGQSFIALVDTSASMKAMEGGQARIDQARDALMTMIDDLGKGDEMMIVAFDREARVVQTFTDDKSRLKMAANAIEARDSTSTIGDALILARTASEARSTPIVMEGGETAQGESNVEVVVLSDGAIGDLDRTPEDLPPVRYVPIGQPGANVGIVNVDLRETFERESDRQILATIENFGASPVETILEFHLNGELLDAKEVRAEPGAASAVIFSNLMDKSGSVELRLRAADKLDVDNVAFGTLAKPAPTRILLVADNNFFLERMLAANPDFEVYLATPGQYSGGGDYDVVIFDNFTPPQLPPGRYLMFNALPPLDDFTQEDEALASPAIIDWNRVHPLARYVNFESINIRQAMHVNIPSWAHVLAEGELSPLIYAFERDQRQVVAVAFDIYQTDWPLRVSFPIFVANTLNWLARSGEVGEAFSLPVGSTVPFTAESGQTRFEVKSPSGEERTLELQEGDTGYYAQTDEIGFYHVAAGDSATQFSVNLLSARESNLLPSEMLEMRDRTVAGNPSALKQNREVWFLFALAALAVLALEWTIYCRRSWA